MERGTVRVKCLGQEHIVLNPSKENNRKKLETKEINSEAIEELIGRYYAWWHVFWWLVTVVFVHFSKPTHCEYIFPLMLDEGCRMLLHKVCVSPQSFSWICYLSLDFYTKLCGVSIFARLMVSKSDSFICFYKWRLLVAWYRYIEFQLSNFQISENKVHPYLS